MKGTKAIIFLALALVLAFSATGAALAQSRSSSPEQLQARDLGERPGRGFMAQRHAVIGEVTKVVDNIITVETHQGPKTVTVTTDTIFRLPGQDTATLADVTVGKRVAIVVKKDNDTLTAQQVIILPPKPVHIQGTITAVTGNQVTVKDKDGNVSTITLPAGSRAVSVDEPVKITIGRPMPALNGLLKNLKEKHEDRGKHRGESQGHQDDVEDD